MSSGLEPLLMEFRQEQITTLHAFDGHHLDPSMESVVCLLPMTEREFESDRTRAILESIEQRPLAGAIVALKARPSTVDAIKTWIHEIAPSVTVLWCNAPDLEAEFPVGSGLASSGKGRDLWLGLMLAREMGEEVVIRDADGRLDNDRTLERLVWPLQHDIAFVKGYYARVSDRLYGRLCRLCWDPLIEGLGPTLPVPLYQYLRAFRYGLAGECAFSLSAIESIRPPTDLGFEVGILTECFEAVGPAQTAQVDLGIYEHTHRPLRGQDGLGRMSEAVVGALFDGIEEHVSFPPYEVIASRYEREAKRLVRQYSLDARANGLEPDAKTDQQIDRYREAIINPATVTRLPALEDDVIATETIRKAGILE